MGAAVLTTVLGYCRAGFERECAAEIAAAAGRAGLAGSATEAPGFAAFGLTSPAALDRLDRALRCDELVFARQLVFATDEVTDMPPRDRIAPLLPRALALGRRFSGLHVDTADTNEAKTLSAFCRSFAPRFGEALAAAGASLDDATAGLRLHLVFAGASRARAGVSRRSNSSPWPMGIPRLRLPREAPSRAVRKLAEAFLTLFDEGELATRLKPGMRAVDLGAAPGGWSWLLASRGLDVTAVDNGPIDPAVLASGLVSHVRADGFRFRPPRPVRWLTCDMVEQPARIAELCARWLAAGDCHDAVFNLKLPMKRRLEEVERCRGIIAARLGGGGGHVLRMKQLYHDREEITARLSRLDGAR